MLRNLAILIASLAVAAVAYGQGLPGGAIARGTAAELAAVPTPTAQTFIVTDGNSGTDCSTGGGSTQVHCAWTGAAWVALPSTGGGGGAVNTIAGDTGGATSGADVTLAGGTNVSTTRAGDTITIDGTAHTAPGGTIGQTQVNDGAGGFAGVAEGTAGQILTSNGLGVAPTMQNPASSAAGTVGQVQTSDGSGGFVAVAEGTAAQVLTSQGAGVAPLMQDLPVTRAGATVRPLNDGDSFDVRTAGGTATIVLDAATGTLTTNSLEVPAQSGVLGTWNLKEDLDNAPVNELDVRLSGAFTQNMDCVISESGGVATMSGTNCPLVGVDPHRSVIYTPGNVATDLTAAEDDCLTLNLAATGQQSIGASFSTGGIDAATYPIATLNEDGTYGVRAFVSDLTIDWYVESECVATDNPVDCCTGAATGPTCPAGQRFQFNSFYDGAFQGTIATVYPGGNHDANGVEQISGTFVSEAQVSGVTQPDTVYFFCERDATAINYPESVSAPRNRWFTLIEKFPE